MERMELNECQNWRKTHQINQKAPYHRVSITVVLYQEGEIHSYMILELFHPGEVVHALPSWSVQR